jgi:hypothetical protein
LQDHGYDRKKYKFGMGKIPIHKKFLFKFHNFIKKNINITFPLIEKEIQRYFGLDQTRFTALAQIECIIQKIPS